MARGVTKDRIRLLYWPVPAVCRGAGPFGTYSSCTKTTMVEHIVHIDGAPEPSAHSAGCSEAEAY